MLTSPLSKNIANDRRIESIVLGFGRRMRLECVQEMVSVVALGLVSALTREFR